MWMTRLCSLITPSIRTGRAGRGPLVERSLEVTDGERGRSPTAARIPRPLNKRIGGHVLHEIGNAPPAVLARVKERPAQLALAEAVPAHRDGRQVPVRR